MELNTIIDLTQFLSETAERNRDVTLTVTNMGIRVTVSRGASVRRHVSWIEIIMSNGTDLEAHVKEARSAVERMLA